MKPSCGFVQCWVTVIPGLACLRILHRSEIELWALGALQVPRGKANATAIHTSNAHFMMICSCSSAAGVATKKTFFCERVILGLEDQDDRIFFKRKLDLGILVTLLRTPD